MRWKLFMPSDVLRSEVSFADFLTFDFVHVVSFLSFVHPVDRHRNPA